MAEETEFTVGTQASCSDGLCGEVSRMIFDPASGAITHLVVEPRHHRHRGRLVPVGLAEAAAGQVRLACTLEEFGRLDPAEETELDEDAGYGGGYGGPE